MPSQSLKPLIIYTTASGLLIVLASLSSWTAFLYCFALSPLLVAQDQGHAYWHLALAGILPFALWTFFTGFSGFPLVNYLGWLLFLVAAPLWGRQRSFLGFLFLLVSAEALPYYSFINNDWQLSLGAELAQIEWLAPSFTLLGLFGHSLLILLSNLLFSFLIPQIMAKKLSIGLLLSFLFFTGLPVLFSLMADGSNASYLIPQGNFDHLIGADQFLARMSFFIAFFLLLFALVRKLLPQNNSDDRFT